MNVSAWGKSGAAPSNVPELSVKSTVNVSALPCVSELSATVTMTWALGAPEVNVMELALKTARDAPSPVLLKPKLTESPSAMSVGWKEIMAAVPSGMTW